MAPDDLKAAVKEAVAEALAAQSPCRQPCCSTCDLEPGEHRDHHQTLRGAFSVRRQIISVVVTAVTGGALLWLGVAIWEKVVRQAVGK